MLRDNLVGLIVPMQCCGTQALGDEFSYLENPRPVGAESSLTESASSPFQTEPRHKGIPFIKIADHVDVNFHLNWKHVGGPPLA